MTDSSIQSYSFTTDDAMRSKDSNLQFIAECFDNKYDKQYKEKFKDHKAIFEKDINRQGILYIQTQDGKLVDLVAPFKEEKGEEYKITYQDMYDKLTNDYQLSDKQAEYILIANHQGSIAGGIAGLGRLTATIMDEEAYMSNSLRNGVVAKIVIDQDNNLSYVTSQKECFDCHMQAFLPESSLRNMMVTKFNSQDSMAINISANLGKLGEDASPTVTVDIAGKGRISGQVIAKLKEIDTSCQPQQAEDIIKRNTDFTNELVPCPLTDDDQYKNALVERMKEIMDKMQEEEIAPEIISSLKKAEGAQEGFATLLANKIDEAIANNKDQETNKLSQKSIEEISNMAAEGVTQFIGNYKEYEVRKFTQQLVKERGEQSGVSVDSKRKNVIERICEYLKDKWHGYSEDKSLLYNKAKDIGLTVKRCMSSETRPSFQPNQHKSTERTH